MHQYVIRNGTPFPMQELKVIKGSIPNSILGSYIKNGPGLLTQGDQMIPHWFIGNSGLLKIEFHDGKAYAKYKMVETPAYKKDIQQKSFERSHPIVNSIKSIFESKLENHLNPVNTNVLRQPNSDKFLALCQGGFPYELSEKLMAENQFRDFGFIKRAFSAHPKIDPDNHDIYNIGMNMGYIDVYRISKNFKLLAEGSLKLRVPQSIHDCCLAGDYLVVFECPIKVDLCKFMRGNFFFKCISPDYDFSKTIVWIYKKQNLELVKKMEITSPEAFFMFHFTNGYTENNKLYVQYAKYPGESARQILEFVDYVPNYASKNGNKRSFQFDSQLETLEVDLTDFSYKFSTKDINCEFPICEDSEVGKKWRYSYFISKNKGGDFFSYDRLVRYDRFSEKTLVKHFPGCVIVEPALIHTKDGLFVLVLKSSSEKCSIDILEGETFQTVAEIQLPEYIPFGYHGKWIDLENKITLQSANFAN